MLVDTHDVKCDIHRIHTWVGSSSQCNNLIHENTKRPHIGLDAEDAPKGCLWCRPFYRKLSVCGSKQEFYEPGQLCLRRDYKMHVIPPNSCQSTTGCNVPGRSAISGGLRDLQRYPTFHKRIARL